MLNTAAWIGLHDGMDSICIVDEYAFDAVPENIRRIAHVMAIEAMLADDAKIDRIKYPHDGFRMRTSELVRVSVGA